MYSKPILLPQGAPVSSFSQLFVFGALFFVFVLGARAQSPTFHTVMVPSSANEGDTVRFEVHIDATATISGFETDFYFDPALYDLSDLTSNGVGSSLGDPADLDITTTISGDTVLLDVERIDLTAVDVSGKVLNLDGIVILDDIHTKRGALLNPRPEIVCFPNPTLGKVQVKGHAQVVAMLLVNGQGRQFPLTPSPQLDLSAFPPGTYSLVMRTQSGEQVVHKVVLQ